MIQGLRPRTGSTNFQILGVYLSDPMKSDGYLNATYRWRLERRGKPSGHALS